MKIDSDTYSLTDKASSNDNAYIEAVGDPSTLTNPMYLQDNQWGVAFPASTGVGGDVGNQYDLIDQYEQTLSDPSLALNRHYGMVPRVEDTGYSDEIMSSNTLANNDTQNIYYAVRIDNPVELPAGDYSTSIILTATTNSVKAPTINSVTPNTYGLGSGTDSTVTIAGANLASTYKVYLENNADSSKQYNVTDNVTSVTDAELKVTLPADKTNTDLEPGDYTIHVVTQGGEDSIGFTYTKKALPDGMLESTDDYGDDGHVAVDYDENLIPIKISSNRYGSPTIKAIPKSEIDSDPSVWYDYSADKKQWANAVTVTNPENYKNITSETTINDSDILGYWVYIPRYAYKVMRRDASDRAVSDTTASRNGGFEIKFETASDPKKTPVKCSQTGQDYQTCVGTSALEYPTDPADKDKTAWATHPAFSWGTDADGYEEMNGFWIGKFEATTSNDSSGGYPYPSSNNTPTVLPGQSVYKANSWSGIGDMYDTAKMFGVEDKDNTYSGSSSSGGYPGYPGGSTTVGQNVHNLSIATSHMVKNNEWGAVLYLASSKFGAGINNVEPNSGLATTACGPTAGSEDDCVITNRDAKSASTTGTEYGVFDIVGGTFEPVMAAYGRANTPVSSDGFRSVPRPPYVQIYTMSNSASCTWETCGGDATYETSTSTIDGPNSSSGQFQSVMWGSGIGMFVDSTYPWGVRSMMAMSAGADGSTMYNFVSLDNQTIPGSSASSFFSLRVVLRNSMDSEMSGGDSGDDGDEEEEGSQCQPGETKITAVSPNSLSARDLERVTYQTFRITGCGLTNIGRIELIGDENGMFDCENYRATSDTSATCRANVDDLTKYSNRDTFNATLLDSIDRPLSMFRSFCTVHP